MPTNDIVEWLRAEASMQRLPDGTLVPLNTRDRAMLEAADLLEKLPVDKEGKRGIYGVDTAYCLCSGEIVPTISLRWSAAGWWAYPNECSQIVPTQDFWFDLAAAEAALQEQQAREGE